jgi:hypothetical protein
MRYGLIPLGLAAALIVALPTGALAAPSKVGTESFTFTQGLNGNPLGALVASGVINDTGQDIVISPTEDLFQFPTGAVTVFHSPLHDTQHFNKNACTSGFTEKGTYVFGNGTREWANYSGSGSYKVTGSATDACGPSPIGTVTISATGPITVVNGG